MPPSPPAVTETMHTDVRRPGAPSLIPHRHFVASDAFEMATSFSSFWCRCSGEAAPARATRRVPRRRCHSVPSAAHLAAVCRWPGSRRAHCRRGVHASRRGRRRRHRPRCLLWQPGRNLPLLALYSRSTCALLALACMRAPAHGLLDVGSRSARDRLRGVARYYGDSTVPSPAVPLTAAYCTLHTVRVL